MSVQAEIETFRRRISWAWTNSKDNLQKRWPKEPQLPTGLYDKRQLERWQCAESIIRYSIGEFLSEAGIINHQVELDFSEHLRFATSKAVQVILKFREEETDAEWREDKPFRQIGFEYDPGGKFTPEGIRADYAYIVAPKKLGSGTSVTVDQALAWLDDDSVSTFNCVHVTSSVDVNSLKNLLKVLAANPTVSAPVEGLIPR